MVRRKKKSFFVEADKEQKRLCEQNVIDELPFPFFYLLILRKRSFNLEKKSFEAPEALTPSPPILSQASDLRLVAGLGNVKPSSSGICPTKRELMMK